MTRISSMRTLLVAAAGISLLSSLPAAAQGIDIQIGKHGIHPVVRDDPRDGCSPGDALSAAREEGFHHPRIAHVSDRSVVVEGFTDDGPDQIRFANVPGCPER